MMSYDPAFTNTASCRSAITYIDGEAGILEHRGYSIEQLCEQLDLPRGRLPADLRRAADRSRSSTAGPSTSPTTPSSTRTSSSSSRASATTPTRWGCCSPAVGALSTFYPDAKQIDDPEERYMAAVRLIAKVPTLAAFAYRHNMGLPYVYPDNDLNYAENFLSMMFKKTEAQARARTRALSKALDVLFILHADHEQNCSTNAVRGVGSSRRRPLLGGRRRRRRPLRAAARRRQRGGAADAAADRDRRRTSPTSSSG